MNNQVVQIAFRQYGRSFNINSQEEGRKVDHKFLEYVKRRGVDPYGEYGEFHTFVTAEPIFNGKIEFVDTDILNKRDNWVLDVNQYHVLSNKRKFIKFQLFNEDYDKRNVRFF